MVGYYAGYEPILIDTRALADPLLARLPVSPTKGWRIGHFTRDIPPGYVHARRTGDTSRMGPAIAQYYEKLRLVTSGDLWDKERLKTILGFQLGWYDGWLNEYIKNTYSSPVSEIPKT